MRRHPFSMYFIPLRYSKPSATCLHKYAWRGLTKTLREKYENVIIDLRNLHGIYIWSSGGSNGDVTSKPEKTHNL